MTDCWDVEISGLPVKGEAASKWEPGCAPEVDDLQIHFIMPDGTRIDMTEQIRYMPGIAVDTLADKILTEAAEREDEDYQAHLEDEAERRSGR